MNIKLEKIESTNNNLRTKTVNGYCETLPVLNKRFEMSAESLTGNGLFRYIGTSPVVEILAQNSKYIEFKTENSKYKIEIIDPLN